MAAYPSWKEVVKNEKRKKLPKLNIYSAMAVMDNLENNYCITQDKTNVKKLSAISTKRKEKRGCEYGKK